MEGHRKQGGARTRGFQQRTMMPATAMQKVKDRAVGLARLNRGSDDGDRQGATERATLDLVEGYPVVRSGVRAGQGKETKDQVPPTTRSIAVSRRADTSRCRPAGRRTGLTPWHSRVAYNPHFTSAQR
jgi:hypothetical protein